MPGIPTWTRLPSSRSFLSVPTATTLLPINVKASATFERQLNAAKAIANLLNIIKQATANANSATQSIAVLQSEQNAAKIGQQTVQMAVSQVQGNLTRLNGGIDSIKNNINSIKT